MKPYAKFPAPRFDALRCLITLTILIALQGVVACSADTDTTNAVTLDALIMPAPAGFEIERIELKSMIRNTSDPEVQGRAVAERKHLAQMGILATGYFKYPRASGGGFRVKINIYDQPATLLTDWERRYPPLVQEGAEPLASIPGFMLPNKAVVMHDSTVMVEITSYKGAGDLEAFAHHFIAHLKSVHPEG